MEAVEQEQQRTPAAFRAVDGDDEFVALANGSDVYVAMARRLFAAELPAEALALPAGEFGRAYRGHRARAKAITLGIL